MRALRPFVVEWDEEIVGYADFQPNGYIDHFSASGSCARQGIGTLLMKHIQKAAQLLGIDDAGVRCEQDCRAFLCETWFLSGKARAPSSASAYPCAVIADT